MRCIVALQTPNFPTRDEVLILHADQIATYGGMAGLRDAGLLDSALAQPMATFGGEWRGDRLDLGKVNEGQEMGVGR